MVTSVETFNYDDLKFEDLQYKELAGLNRHYYMQNLKHQDKDLYIQTDWFTGNGVKEAFDNKKEMLVSLTPTFHSFLKGIEEVAIRNGLKLPVEFQTGHAVADIFKRLPEQSNLFIKLNYDASCFNQNGQVVKMESLSHGDYRAVVHVKGLYIGHHPAGKLVSLQLRIVQIQFVPRQPLCLFVPIPAPALQNESHDKHTVVHVPETPQPGIESAPLVPTPAKKGRRSTKAQKQNAANEAKVQQEEQRRLESVPAEFFNDALMELNTQSNL